MICIFLTAYFFIDLLVSASFIGTKCAASLEDQRPVTVTLFFF